MRSGQEKKKEEEEGGGKKKNSDAFANLFPTDNSTLLPPADDGEEKIENVEKKKGGNRYKKKRRIPSRIPYLPFTCCRPDLCNLRKGRGPGSPLKGGEDEKREGEESGTTTAVLTTPR